MFSCLNLSPNQWLSTISSPGRSLEELLPEEIYKSWFYSKSYLSIAYISILFSTIKRNRDMAIGTEFRLLFFSATCAKKKILPDNECFLISHACMPRISSCSPVAGKRDTLTSYEELEQSPISGTYLWNYTRKLGMNKLTLYGDILNIKSSI